MTEYILAVETGGTKLQMALGTGEGEILFNHRCVIRPENGCQGILEDIIQTFPLLKKEAKKRGGKITRVGIGFGGPVDVKQGMVIASVQVPGWERFSVMDFFRERLDVPAYIYNDSNAATWGEYCRGIGRGTKNFFYTNIGSGVGGGVVINGELYEGQGYGAAEIGHTWICDIGNPQPVKVENVCSGWAIERKLREADLPKDSKLWEISGGRQENISCAMLGEAVRLGDKYAGEFLDHIAKVFSIALANIIDLFSPERIVVGGGVSLIGEPLMERLVRFTKPYVFINNVDKYCIQKSVLDESIVLVGTLLLAGKR